MDARTSNGRPKGEINVTPLVDIVLVLLIILMVITPLLQTGIPSALPERSGRAGGPAIVLQIASDGSLSLNREAVRAEDLGDKLSAVFAARDSKTLFVDADDKASYDTVVRTLDVCRTPGRAGTIGFVLN